MANGLRVCFDRILPADLKTGPVVPPMPGAMPRAAFERAKLWPLGASLRVAFLDGDSTQQGLVRQHAPTWSKYANLTFDFVNNTNPQIRITFNPNDGAWSYIGLDCSTIPKNQPTMNLGWQDEGVILHEFGHTLGLIHEHQNPSGGIKWNKEQVYRDLGGSPNFWDKATVDANMFAVYNLNQVNATKVDPKSIMMYQIPESWTTDKFSAGENNVLSEQDKVFVGDPRNYPKAGPRI
jgi:hypothetical protein